MHHLNASMKRLLDVVLVSCGIIVCLPLALLVCTAIKLDSRGPILFSQMRVGHRGKLFRLYKFRKFYHTGTSDGPAVTSNGDRRMTRVGRILQQTKLDELPQLWNVLRGDMSLVGPRPEAIDFADCFHSGFERLLDYKPGLFGPNQMFFRDEGALFAQQADPEQYYRHVLFGIKARVDLTYFGNSNVFLDLWWMVRGVITVIFPRPAAAGSTMLADVEKWMQKNNSM